MHPAVAVSEPMLYVGLPDCQLFAVDTQSALSEQHRACLAWISAVCLDGVDAMLTSGEAGLQAP